jgi:sulfoxide reductase heme-binding subunit YedZ
MPNAWTDPGTIFSTWHIARAAGLTAYLLLFIITACGLLFTLQVVPTRYRPFVMHLHKASVIACIAFTLLHGMILMLDKHIHFSAADVFIPFWSDYKSWETALGIVAFYVISMVTITSVPAIMKVLDRKMWQKVHYLAFPCYWLAVYHGVVLGTDSHNISIIALYVCTSGTILTLTLLRIWKSIHNRGVVYAHSARRR